MSSKRILHVAIALGLIVLFIACSLKDVSFENKTCPCGVGYVCDTTRNVCVATLSGSNDGGISVGADGGGSGTCRGETCPCTVDAECTDPVRAHCGPEKLCVECIASPDSCPVGSYCNPAHQCVLGCKAVNDCQISPLSPHCNMDRHQCVACRTVADCVDADACSPSGECVQGCDIDAGKVCPPGKSCCQGFCLDTTKDPLNCGACSVACSSQNATPACVDSTCSWACATGYAHCTTTNTGCETNTRADVTRCGSCTTNCNVGVVNAQAVTCNVGSCSYTSCLANWEDCDSNRANGCECSCGTKKNERCCPGGLCNPPFACIGGPSNNKCQ